MVWEGLKGIRVPFTKEKKFHVYLDTMDTNKQSEKKFSSRSKAGAGELIMLHHREKGP